MKEKCPVCRAALKDSPICRRCRSDLTSLLEIKAKAEDLALAATKALADGNHLVAADLARQSEFLHNTPYIRALRGVIKSKLTEAITNYI